MINVTKFLKRFDNHDIFGSSARATYYLLLSFFPMCLLLLSLFQGTGVLETLLPPSVTPLLNDISKPSAAFQTSSGIIILWSASSSIWAWMTGIHAAYTGNSKIKLLEGRFRALLFLFILVAVIFLCVSLTFFSRAFVSRLTAAFPVLNRNLLNALRIFILIISIYLFVTLLYLLTPNIRVRARDVSLGAGLTAMGWIVATWGFEVYMRLFNNYSAIYGSLEVFLGLTIWLYIISTILLCGAEINVILYENNNTTKK